MWCSTQIETSQARQKSRKVWPICRKRKRQTKKREGGREEKRERKGRERKKQAETLDLLDKDLSQLL